jgi:transposase-like protein
VTIRESALLAGDLTKRVLEAGLEAEMTGHPGYERHDLDESVPPDA